MTRPGAGSAASRASRPEILTAGLRAQVGAYIEAARGRELGFLLVGRASRRIVEEAIPFRPQEASMVSFRASPEAVRAAVAEVRRRGGDLLGVAHLHPGRGPRAAFHSETDVEAIEGELLPLLATTVMRPESRQRRATLVSLVFAQDLSAYAVRLTWRWTPAPAGWGTVTLVERSRPVVRVLREGALGLPAAPMPNLHEIARVVREELLPAEGALQGALPGAV